jgi:hypothetical protein
VSSLSPGATSVCSATTSLVNDSVMATRPSATVITTCVPMSRFGTE